MPSKLSFHLMGFDSRIFDYLTQMQPSLVKIFEFSSDANIDEIRRRCPRTLIVYRPYTNLSFNDSADTFIAQISDTLNKLAGRGIIWEGLNEPILTSEADARAVSNWYVRFAERMHARGERVAAFSFSTGNPPLQYIPLLLPAIVACDYIALHEYYHPTNGKVDWARYRAFRAQIPVTARKPILLTECGLDDGRNNGWRAYLSADAYLQILKEYDAELMQDSDVLGCTIFQYGAGGTWQSFDLTTIGDRIAQYVADQGGGAVIEPPSPVKMPAHIYAIHDLGGEGAITGGGRSGWIVDSVNLATQTSYDYTALTVAGIEPIVRLNNGYGTAGTIPTSDQYDAFAAKCAAYVRNSRGARIWIIGNEMNLEQERPELSSGVRQVITPEKYASCFLKCRAAIKSVPGHADDWVIPGAVAPVNADTKYAGNERGDWVKYWLDILTLIGDSLDALALHCYTQQYDVTQITSEEMMAPPFTDRHFRFRMYRDFLNALPERFRSLPVLITETNPSAGWGETNIGWIQAAYREIAEWNAVPTHQPIQALALFRWQHHPDRPEWGIEGNNTLLDDFRRALDADYRTRQPIPATTGIVQVVFSPTNIVAGNLLQVTLTIRNTGATTLPTQGPDPGFIYEEGDTFRSRGYDEIGGNYRVGVDFDGRTGIDHPYRWGFGAPLAPGETRTITGAIRLKTPQARNYWAGLVNERIAWLQDQQGKQMITVGSGVQITSVTFTPTTVGIGQTLQVGITVRNDSAVTLPTQGPDPGLVYEEGETFVTRGFASETSKYRVGIDFDQRTGIDHPYRWGFGAPLAPGETRTITGAIRMKDARVQNYWAGLVNEYVAWIQDKQGMQAITVVPGTPGVEVVSVTFTPTTLGIGDLLNVSITVRNNGSAAAPTQGPDPGFVYDEGDTFRSRGFTEVSGAYRVGIDFDNRSGIDHPYRWGFGAPLAPGETRTITGAIRMKNVQAREYWLGLVQELVAWKQDRLGAQRVTVRPPLAITSVTFSPTTLDAGQQLNVNVTVRNDSALTLSTQGPDPGFVYNEGDTFRTRGFNEVSGAYRVGIEFDNRTGIDHPYRWGLGAPLAPGESRAISGGIRLTRAQTQNYWAGAVQEMVAWWQDRQGTQRIVVSPPSGKPRVVHIHSDRATTWVGQPDYWNYVNQDVVNAMMDRGVMTLTNTTSVAEAWRAILPRYQPGQGIAIKVNWNNNGNGNIDASIQTINALIRGLKQIGVRENDIWIFDAIKRFTTRFVNACLYPGVLFFDDGTTRRAGFDSTDPTARVTFTTPPDLPPHPSNKITDVLVNATYVINVPLLKGHTDLAGVTLGFKNHLGSVTDPASFHPYIFPGETYFRSYYNSLVDLYRNPNIGAKTVLTIGDGLFTGKTWGSPALMMATFGNKPPNSLFFALDPVAIDCVMYDFLDAEWHIKTGADNYLRLASQQGLGVFERGDPWGAGYATIEYRRIEVE
jgi:hypothetical protein